MGSVNLKQKTLKVTFKLIELFELAPYYSRNFISELLLTFFVLGTGFLYVTYACLQLAIFLPAVP